jgi:hypothetical protein
VQNASETRKCASYICSWCYNNITKVARFTQDHFICFVLSDLRKRAQNWRRRKHPIKLVVRMDNSRWHNGQKVLDKMRRNHMIGRDHAAFSPNLSSCDFWVSGVLRNRIKETVFRTVGKVEDCVCSFWSEATLDEVQLVFHEWMRRLEWAANTTENMFLNKLCGICTSSRPSQEGWTGGGLLAPLYFTDGAIGKCFRIRLLSSGMMTLKMPRKANAKTDSTLLRLQSLLKITVARCPAHGAVCRRGFTGCSAILLADCDAADVLVRD